MGLPTVRVVSVFLAATGGLPAGEYPFGKRRLDTTVSFKVIKPLSLFIA